MPTFTFRLRRAPPRLAFHLLALAGALVVLAPLYFLAVFATHTSAEILGAPPPLAPGDALGVNWEILQLRIPFLGSVVARSLYVAALQAGLAVVLCSLAGFAFAMYEFRLKRTLFLIGLAAMCAHPLGSFVPKFLLLRQLGLIDRPVGLWLPGAASALGVFFLWRYIAAVVPRHLVDAARCDGCPEWRIWWSVVLPLVRPGLLTLGVFVFLASWNDFLGPLLVLQTYQKFTLPLAFRSMMDPNETPWGAVMVAGALSLVPPLLVLILSFRRVMAALKAAASDR